MSERETKEIITQLTRIADSLSAIAELADPITRSGPDGTFTAPWLIMTFMDLIEEVTTCR